MPYKTSLRIYLRPIEALEPFYIRGCAMQLVRKRWFETFKEAIAYLNFLQINHPWKFKGIMSSYITFMNKDTDYSAIEPKEDILTLVNQYQSSATNFYGEDAHMWWHTPMRRQ